MTVTVATDYILDMLYAHSALMTKCDDRMGAMSILGRDNAPMLRRVVTDAFMELTADMAPRSYLCGVSDEDRMLKVECEGDCEALPGALSMHLATAVVFMTLHLICRAGDKERKARDYLTLARGSWKSLARALRGRSCVMNVRSHRY